MSFLQVCLLLLYQISCVTTTKIEAEQCGTHISNYGKTFYFAKMDHYINIDDPILLKIVSNTSGYMQIYAPGIGLNRTYALIPGITKVPLNGSLVRSNSQGIESKGMLLEATTEVAVFVLDGLTETGLSETLLLVPVAVDSKTFVVQSYEPYWINSSQFIIVASQDFTKINISLNTIGRLTYNQTVYRAGDLIGLSLDRLQTFHLYNDHDLTGTVIQSNKPIAVFAGSRCSYIPLLYGYCDMLEKQLIPVPYWDTSYIIPSIYPSSQCVLRVTAYYNNTKVFIAGARSLKHTLNKGGVWDIFQETKPVVITSDKVIAVVLFNAFNGSGSTFGSPFMLTIPGLTDFSSLVSYTFPTHQSELGKQFSNYVSIIVHAQFKTYLRYNGSPPQILQEYTVPLPFNQYVVLVVKLNNGSSHTITDSPVTPIAMFVYGMASNEAYGSLAGVNLSNTGCMEISTKRTTDTTSAMNSTGTAVLTTMLTSSAEPLTATPTHAHPSRMRCFSCSSIGRLCDYVQLCQKGEVCFVSSKRATDGQIVNSSGCIDEQSCPHEASEDQVNQYRSDPVCRTCCYTDVCNMNCTHNKYTAPIIG